MKIHAAQRLKVTAESIKDYQSRLARMDIKPLGTGQSSTVYQHPKLKDVAVKLSLINDVGYNAFLKICQTLQGNPYVPVIYGVHEASEIFDGPDAPNLQLVFMEKLRPITSDEYLAFGNTLAQSQDIKITFKRPSQLDDWISPSLLLRPKKIKNDNHLRKLAVCLGKAWKIPISWDMHQANLMMRGSQVVFVDPLSYARGKHF